MVAATPVDALRDALVANRVTVHGPVGAADAPELVVARAVELVGAAGERPGPVAVAPGDPLVDALAIVDALRATSVEVLLPGDDDWRARLPDAVLGITAARLAVAETGSLAHVAAPGAPRGVSLLPPVHLCLVALDTVVPTFADAIAFMARGALPSALTWIGGPSRTGDLEMIQTFGVHGPAAVEVVLVG